MHWFHQHSRLITVLLKTLSCLTSHQVMSVTQCFLNSIRIHLYSHGTSDCSHLWWGQSRPLCLYIPTLPGLKMGCSCCYANLIISPFIQNCSSTSLTVMQNLFKWPCMVQPESYVFTLCSPPANTSWFHSHRNFL